jgi:hypothetical protein
MANQINVLGEIERTYFQLRDNFDTAYQKCENYAERQQLRAVYDSARDAYWKAIADSLADDNPVVRGLLDDLKKTNKQVGDMLVDLKNVVSFLHLVTEAVKLAAAVATLAAV